jgi:hypothetical protein
MTELNKNRFWLAIGRQGVYSEEDNFIFRVWPKAESKNHSWDLMPKFIEGESLEDARRRLHWFIDKMFNDFYVPADKEAGTYVPPPSPTMDGLDSLTIGSSPAGEVKSNTDGLLNLGDLA